MRELDDLPALRAMRTTHRQPLRGPIRGAEDHRQAQEPQVPILYADPVADELDLLESDLVIGPGETALQIDVEDRGVAEIGTRVLSRQVVRSRTPLCHRELAQADRQGLIEIPAR